MGTEVESHLRSAYLAPGVALLVQREPIPYINNLVSVVPCFNDLEDVVFLDSATNTSDMGRYSYLTADPFILLRSNNGIMEVTRGNRDLETQGSPWDVLKGLIEEYDTEPVEESFPFEGGAVGYWSYDLGRTVEELPVIARRSYEYPEMLVGFYDWVLVHDHIDQKVTLVTTTYNEGHTPESRRQWVVNRINQPSLASQNNKKDQSTENVASSNFSPEAYETEIKKVKRYLEAGDIYQANISQRFKLPFSGDPWSLYLKLRAVNPGAFATYLTSPDLQILSSSPELFLSLRGKQVTTRPIKGTHPRGIDHAQDLRYAEELLNSEKDRAENVMIVDLMRNDLGKVCEVGSVQVTSLNQVEKHPTVWHLVSTIVGKLKANNGPVDLLRNCFPGGSITGAPKIRAMEIIEEIEPVRRGVYCGSIGYISFTGNMLTNIAIRTMVLENGEICFHSGGGIVADSDPSSEYNETIDKAAGLMESLGLGAWQRQ